MFNLSFLLLLLSPKTLRISIDENLYTTNCMKKDKPKNQNIFQSVADRLSRFFGKEATTEPESTPTPAAPSKPVEPKQEEPSDKGAEAPSVESEAPTKRVRVRRSRVKVSRPKSRMAEKKEKAEAATSIYELPSGQVGPAIREFVLAHLSDESLSVETMAAQLKVSRTNLYTIVHREFSVTPADYILDLRLKKAETLLKEGLKVREVAMKCGFADPKYFSKVFKKYYGILPSTFSTK